jgi:hypothetical protein
MRARSAWCAPQDEVPNGLSPEPRFNYAYHSGSGFPRVSGKNGPTTRGRI